MSDSIPMAMREARDDAERDLYKTQRPVMGTDEAVRAYIEAKRDKANTDCVYAAIRSDVIDSLLRYAYEGVPTGGFLHAVLCNDLREAVARADRDNERTLKAIVTFCYMEIPAPCWGSAEKVTAWIERFRGNEA